MIPCVAKRIPQEDQNLLNRVRSIVEWLPDIDLGNDDRGQKILLSCHILARVVAKIFSLKLVDGYFYPSYCHSWLVTKNSNVIDVYPVEILSGPILVSGTGLGPARWLYEEATSEEYFIKQMKERAFQEAVKKIVKIIYLQEGLP